MQAGGVMFRQAHGGFCFFFVSLSDADPMKSNVIKLCDSIQLGLI